MGEHVLAFVQVKVEKEVLGNIGELADNVVGEVVLVRDVIKVLLLLAEEEIIVGNGEEMTGRREERLQLCS